MLEIIKRLPEFIYSDEGYDLLEHSAYHVNNNWSCGASWVLAEAISQILKTQNYNPVIYTLLGNNTLAGRMRLDRPDPPFTIQTFVTRVDNFWIDSGGPNSQDEILDFWKYEHGIINIEFRPLSDIPIVDISHLPTMEISKTLKSHPLTIYKLSTEVKITGSYQLVYDQELVDEIVKFLSLTI